MLLYPMIGLQEAHIAVFIVIFQDSGSIFAPSKRRLNGLAFRLVAPAGLCRATSNEHSGSVGLWLSLLTEHWALLSHIHIALALTKQ